MSLERVIKALVNLGLSRSDAEVYVYTAKKGPQTVMGLHNSLNYSRHQINNSLKTLIALKLVNKEGTMFSAIPFEEVLDLLIKMKKEKAQVMHEGKEELLATWETKDY